MHQWEPSFTTYVRSSFVKIDLTSLFGRFPSPGTSTCDSSPIKLPSLPGSVLRLRPACLHKVSGRSPPVDGSQSPVETHGQTSQIFRDTPVPSTASSITTPRPSERLPTLLPLSKMMQGGGGRGLWTSYDTVSFANWFVYVEGVPTLLALLPSSET